MQTLLTRIFSAVAALIVLIAMTYFLKESGIHLMIFIVVAYGGYEFIRMMLKKLRLWQKILLWASYVGLFALNSPGPFEERAQVFLLSVSLFAVIMCAFFILLHEQLGTTEIILKKISMALLGTFYILVLPTIAAWILYSYNGMNWFYTMLIIVFASDIGAYLTGSRLGKTKLAPVLSPKKSLEGAIGGLTFSIFAGLACSLLLPNVPMPVLMLAGLGGGLLGMAGDFFESLLKRVADVKDSGSFMPGHGGILDRVDSVLFCTPLFLILAQVYTL